MQDERGHSWPSKAAGKEKEEKKEGGDVMVNPYYDICVLSPKDATRSLTAFVRISIINYLQRYFCELNQIVNMAEICVNTSQKSKLVSPYTY